MDTPTTWFFNTKKSALVNKKLLKEQGIKTRLVHETAVAPTGVTVTVCWKLVKV